MRPAQDDDPRNPIAAADSTRMLAALAEAARSICASLDLPTIFERVFDHLTLFVAYDSASILLLRDQRSPEMRLIVAGWRGFPEHMGFESIEIHVTPETVNYPVMAGGRALVLEDVRSHIGWQKVGAVDRVRSWIGVPLSVEGRTIGMMTIDSHRANSYSDHHAALALAFAGYVAVAIRNAQLYAESQRAYEELNLTQQQLFQHEKLRVMGQLASGVAHDFNNVLTSIIGNVQLLIIEAIDADTQSALRVIERAAQDGAVIVRRLQEFSRPHPTGPLLQADLRQVVADALELTRPRWHDPAATNAQRVRIVTALEPAVTAAVEVAELRQVLVNLIMNALDAMPQGGTLRLVTGTNEHEVFVHVQDSGVGIPPEFQARIFDPFVTTKGSRGSGMGLAIAHAVVTRHAGRITLSSEPNQGSTFTVWLPGGATLIEQVAPAEQEATKQAAQSILVVDDDQEICTMLARALQSRGHTVTVASNGRDALEQLREHSFDLIITDLGMPEVSGWDLIRQVRAKDQQVGIVLISGWGQHLTDAVAQDQQIDATIGKPFTLEHLHQTIAQTLNTTSERRMQKVRKRGII
ncbi:MAG TPA: ATP-binding protein [Roseiflexaceae bacterium]|nr:ATP-binding protein [Roseiflexaceae bacterium]